MLTSMVRYWSKRKIYRLSEVHMNTAIIITVIICLTLIALSILEKIGGKK